MPAALPDVHLLDAIMPPIHYIPATMAGSTGSSRFPEWFSRQRERSARLMKDLREWRPRQTAVANGALVISTAVWATMFPVTEALLEVWDPFLLTAGRLGLAAVILLSVHCLRERAAVLSRTLPWKDIWLLGGVGIAGSTVCLTLGIKHSGAVIAAILAASSPIIAAFLARFLFAIPVARAVVLGALLAVAGGVMAALGDVAELGGIRGGEPFILAAMVIWIWYSQSAQHRLSALPQIAIAALTMFAGAVVLILALPVLVLIGVAEVSYDLSWRSLAMLLYLAAGPASFSLVLWHFGVSRIGITAASIYSNLVPVVVVSIAIAAGRYPTVMHLAGGALVIAGVLFAQLRKRT